MSLTPRGRRFVWPLGVAVVSLGCMLAIWHASSTGYNNYVLLADAWLHGRSWINFPGDFIDAVPYHGRAYIVEGPAPAVLLLPAVAIWRIDTNQTLFANLVGALAVFVACRLCERLGLGRGTSLAATAFVFFGTSLYTCAARGDVWFTAQVVGFTFSLLAIEESLGRGRSWLVAIYALIAGFSRLPLMLALPLYAALLLYRARRSSPLVPYVASLVPGFALVTWYDEVRWKTIGDPGFAIWFRVMDDRSRTGAKLFSLENLPEQVRRFLLQLPDVGVGAPWLTPPLGGFSILVTSLPLVYGVLAGVGFVPMILAIGAFATAIPTFLYYDTGQYQYGMRHALDFEPFLFTLMLLGLKRRPSRMMGVALAAFAVFGAIEGTMWLRSGL